MQAVVDKLLALMRHERCLARLRETETSMRQCFDWFLLASAIGLVLGCEPSVQVPPRGDGGPPLMETDGGETDGGPPRPRPQCEIGETPCHSDCCAEGDVCAANGSCCTANVLCGDTCCGTGEVCEGAVCHLECEAESVRCHDDSGAEVCCSEGEVCAADRCVRPEIPCADFWDCPEETYCEPALGYCLPQPNGEACQLTPSGGQVVPTELWHWDGTGRALSEYNQVMMTPVVANLNDDNEDGVVNQEDIPDVIFSTFCGVSDSETCTGGNHHSDGVLRAVNGADGTTLFDVTQPSLRVIPGAQLAVGDLDDDGLVEIVACGSDPSREGPLMVFEHNGTLKWRSTDPRVKCGQSAPAIADLDADGVPEVFVRYTVLNGRTGAVRWHHACRNPGEYRIGEPTSDPITYEHYPCDYTTAADVDGDGMLEIIGGNVAYRHDGSVLWDRSAEFRDGYPAVGDLDLDGTPEIVVVHSAFDPSYPRGDHQLRVLDHTGADEFESVDINVPALNTMASYLDHLSEGRVAGGGPPTIANFDDDPEPEIALAGAYGYVVFEPNLSVRWFAPTHDHSSRKTGSSVFDFDGDGVAEAVYNDEYWLRVYDGRDGTVRYCECNTSITHWEYPVIVDVNNDGHSEIIVSSNDYFIDECTDAPDACTQARVDAGETAGTHGVRVFAAPERDWVATRRIWNQHTYHVTNITEDGSIPAGERQHWSLRGLNNFRQNVQPGARNIPDLVPIDLAVDLMECPNVMTFHFRIANAGWAASPAGVSAAVYVDDGANWGALGTVRTTRRLLPGESEPMSIRHSLLGRDPSAPVTFRVVVGASTDGIESTVLECRLDNNEASVEASCNLVI